ncbi:MAG: GNAT family N-acetyltransferase [Deinococcales bacterium]
MDRDPGGVSVRRATADDLPFLRTLARRLTAFDGLTTRDPEAIVTSSEETLTDAVERSLLGAPAVAVLVAESGAGEPLGCALVQQNSEYFTGEAEAYVAVLAVTETAERRGVGRALMESAEGWALEHGLSRLALEVFAANHGARSFYRRLGYVEDSLRLVKLL